MARSRRWASLALVLSATVSGPTPTAAQADVSLTFQELGPVLTGPGLGLHAGQGVAWPSAVRLSDGWIRLYYGTASGPSASGPAGLFCAISADGVHFAPEPGQRWSSVSGDVERLADGRWRLYYPHVDSSGIPDGIASAISNDGLGFAAEPGLRLGPLPGARFLSRPAIVRLADGRYRMYVSARPSSGRLSTGPFQIYSATSPDLLSWTLDAGVRQTGGSAPAALANPDGSIMLVFNAELRLGTGPPSYISTASSADGLSFSPKVPTNILGGADPALVALADGRLLMYYIDGGADTPTIYAAVVTLIGPPVVSYPEQPATAVTATSARVSALVDPQGAETAATFEYGTSTAYGDSTDEVSIPATSGRTTLSATLTELSPATTYHFRVKAVNSPGESDGADQTFTTAAPACRPGPNRDRGWEVALPQTTSPTAAKPALARVHRLAGAKAAVERDGCSDYEAAIVGLRSRRSALAMLRRAKALGFRRATLEQS